jgi:dihydroxyacetone kinase phosphoprotein-dependent L subunit
MVNVGTQLTVEQVVEMYKYVGNELIESKPYLTEVDSAIGDGDHGIGMSIGFEAAIKKLNESTFVSVNDVFKAIGMAMISSMGGASGIIFGTMFVGGAAKVQASETLTLEFLSDFMKESLEAIKKRGKAELGDKTMIDALEPAVIGLQEAVASNKSLLEGLVEAERKAEAGVQLTKEYVAKFGRAKSLGERAIGHQDAGATSVYLIFKSMRIWVEGNVI